MTDTPYQVMPPLSADEREALKADIAERGVMVPVEYDEEGNILDGHHRIEICAELGITQWPRLIRYGLSEPEKRLHARRLNFNRRHLTAEQKRAQIEAQLREAPEASNRKIAAGLGVDDKTVGTVRTKLESTAEIPQLDKREGRDKKVRKIVQFVDPSPEGVRGSKLTAKTIHHAERESYREGARNLAKELSDRTAELATGRQFPVIYADPPWRRNAGFTEKSYENHFPTMTWDQIAALPVIARALPDAWLFLWIPRAHLLAATKMTIEIEDRGPIEIPTSLAQRIATQWGFPAYSTCFVWTKTDDDHPDDMGSGLIVRDQDEILLLFKRGRGMPMPATDEKFGSNYRERSKPLGHSRKPEFYRQMIRTMVGPGVQVLELFARVDDEHPLPADFYAWGNQSDNVIGLGDGASIPDDVGVGVAKEEYVDPDTGEVFDSPPTKAALMASLDLGQTEVMKTEALLGLKVEGATLTVTATAEAPPAGRIVRVQTWPGPASDRMPEPFAKIIVEGEPPAEVIEEKIADLIVKHPTIPLGNFTIEREEPEIDARYPGRLLSVSFNQFAKPPSIDMRTDGGDVDPWILEVNAKRIRGMYTDVHGWTVTVDGKPLGEPTAKAQADGSSAPSNGGDHHETVDQSASADLDGSGAGDTSHTPPASDSTKAATNIPRNITADADDLEIPPFLKRGDPACIVKTKGEGAS